MHKAIITIIIIITTARGPRTASARQSTAAHSQASSRMLCASQVSEKMNDTWVVYIGQ